VPATPHVALLRGINLGARNRISMPELRDTLTQAGFEDARTYLQSGNVALTSDGPPEALVERLESLVAERFGLYLSVVVRTRDELADVVRRDPLGDVATNPKRYQVSFLSRGLDPQIARRLVEVAVESERVVVSGREVYAWHPEGVARSKLWALLAGRALGVTATSRNWSTVTALLALADELRR
jgi:uncharacterized protein (DUF1697 family)